MNDDKPKASEEQLAYAGLLGNGAWTGLGILVITFIIYVSGLLPNVVDFNKLQSLWKLRAADYIHETGAPVGWGWASLLNNGDMLNFIGVAVLAGVTMACYLRVVPIFIRKKDTTYLIIALLEVCVLLLAASGILTAGGH
jgi:hypothetical protein